MLGRRPFMLGLGAGALFCSSARAEDYQLVDTWTGFLQQGISTLRLRFVISADASAVLYSLDQGSEPIPAEVTSLDPARIRIEVPGIEGEFIGSFKSAHLIEGEWQQQVQLPLTLRRGEAGLVPEPLTQAMLEASRQACRAPAMAVAAVMRGSERQFWISGERQHGSGVSVTQNDSWHIGSMTKSMTATLVARLVEAGLVSWDDTAGQLLKGLIPNMHPAFESVTFRHLLSHRSGLLKNGSFWQYIRFMLAGEDEITEQRQAMARISLSTEPQGPKETTYIYSNAGYVVAGAMLETKTGKTWEELITAQVFQPLGLSSAGFGPPGKGTRLTQPVGHVNDLGSRLRNVFGLQRLTPCPPDDEDSDNPPFIGPAGHVHMSLGDLLTYLEAHRDQPAFLSNESWRLLQSPPFGGDYAMGWMLGSQGALQHDGTNDRWYTAMKFDPAKGTCVVAAANLYDAAVGSAVGTTLLAAEQAVS